MSYYSEGFHLAATWLHRLVWLLAAGLSLAVGALALLATLFCGFELYTQAQTHSFSFWSATEVAGGSTVLAAGFWPAAGVLAAGTGTIAAGAAMRRFLWAAIRPVESAYSGELPTGSTVTRDGGL